MADMYLFLWDRCRLALQAKLRGCYEVFSALAMTMYGSMCVLAANRDLHKKVLAGRFAP